MPFNLLKNNKTAKINYSQNNENIKIMLKTQNKNTEIYDLAVIGGGPAGMMAAGRAAELGADVILLEKNSSLGKKLLLTGGGRCNLTNLNCETTFFSNRLQARAKFLLSPFSRYGVKDTLTFFENHGLQTKIENEGRVFPISNKAQTVLNVLIKYLQAGNVKIKTGAKIIKLETINKTIKKIELANGDTVYAQTFVLASGGQSYPLTGSDGLGRYWLKELGHNLKPSNPILVPVKIKETWVKELAGVSLENVSLKLETKKLTSITEPGKILFTHFGLSGPLVLNLSGALGTALKLGSVKLSIDLFPEMSGAELEHKLLYFGEKNKNRKIKNGLEVLMRSALISPILTMANINGEQEFNTLSRIARKKLINILKELILTPGELLKMDQAIASSGGLDLKEVDSKTMRSRIVNNLYLAGDLLDIDRPSGGYSLQICWTSGYVAGESAAAASKR